MSKFFYKKYDFNVYLVNRVRIVIKYYLHQIFTLTFPTLLYYYKKVEEKTFPFSLLLL